MCCTSFLLGTWVLVNMTQIAKLGVLYLEGVLEFADTPGAVYEIEADHIVIMGGRLIIGWPDDPFDGLATITLRGNHSSPYFFPGDGPTLGAKAIGKNCQTYCLNLWNQCYSFYHRLVCLIALRYVHL